MKNSATQTIRSLLHYLHTYTKFFGKEVMVGILFVGVCLLILITIYGHTVLTNVNASTLSLCGNQGTPPAIKHVIVVMMENKSYSEVVGSSLSPFQTSLASQCGVATSMFAATHTSAANYLAVSAGEYPPQSPSGCTIAKCTDASNNLYNQLTQKGLSWKGYVQQMPSPCDKNDIFGTYQIGHNPILFYSDIPAATCQAQDISVTDLTAQSGAFWTDLQNQTLPSFSWITPHDCDGCGYNQQSMDAWLHGFITTVQQSNSYQAGNTVIFVTYDEGGNLTDKVTGEDCTNQSLDLPITNGVSAHQESCHIPFFVIYPYTAAGTHDATFFDHYSVTKTVENIFGLPYIAHAADAQTTTLIGHFNLGLTNPIPSGGSPTPTDITPTYGCLGPCPTLSPTPTVFGPSPTPNPTGTVSTSPTPNPCVTTASTGMVHAFKTHTHAKGAISRFILLILEFFLRLLEKLLGITITLPQPGPKPTLAPTIPEPGVTITTAPISLTPAPVSGTPVPVTETPVPTVNPCITPTTVPSIAPTHAVSPTPVPTISVTSATPTTAPATTGMQVKGNQLLKDGKNFLAHGFNMVGVLSPPGCNNGTGVTARSHFGQAEMTAAKSWNANIFRFQVSQPGLATTNASNLSSYITQIKNSVALAESNGFVVILSMQDQSIGCGPAQPMPTAETVTAWKNLAPQFASDPKVMFELFNEPQNNEDSASWQQWLNGGNSPIGIAAVGHQTLLNNIRSLGANNVVLADGGSLAEQLQGIPMLKDTSTGKGVVYAVHPYYITEPTGQSEWDRRFGYLTPSVPVIATEWNYKLRECGAQQPTLAPTFLNYLKSKGIGITAHAFDVQGLLVSDWNWTPTTCPGSSTGPGVATKSFYSTLP